MLVADRYRSSSRKAYRPNVFHASHGNMPGMATTAPDRVRAAAAAIAATRTAMGLGILVAPKLAARIAGIDSELTPTGRLMLGLVGIREVVLGAAVLERVRAGYPSAALLRLNALCDGGDFVILACSIRQRRRLGRVLLGLPMSAAVALAWVAMARSIDAA